MKKMVLLLALLVTSVTACGGSDTDEQSPTTKDVDDKAQSASKKVELPGGLVIEDLVIGTGKEAKPGDTVVCHAEGRLTNGKKFWSSHDDGTTYPFKLVTGRGGVIEGWVKGIPGMRMGGKRKLFIPAAMGYGARAQRGIPANSDLVFVVEAFELK